MGHRDYVDHKIIVLHILLQNTLVLIELEHYHVWQCFLPWSFTHFRLRRKDFPVWNIWEYCFKLADDNLNESVSLAPCSTHRMSGKNVLSTSHELIVESDYNCLKKISNIFKIIPEISINFVWNIIRKSNFLRNI